MKGKIETSIKLKKLNKDWLLVRWLTMRYVALSLVLDQSMKLAVEISS